MFNDDAEFAHCPLWEVLPGFCASLTLPTEGVYITVPYPSVLTH